MYMCWERLGVLRYTNRAAVAARSRGGVVHCSAAGQLIASSGFWSSPPKSLCPGHYLRRPDDGIVEETCNATSLMGGGGVIPGLWRLE